MSPEAQTQHGAVCELLLYAYTDHINCESKSLRHLTVYIHVLLYVCAFKSRMSRDLIPGINCHGKKKKKDKRFSICVEFTTVFGKRESGTGAEVIHDWKMSLEASEQMSNL